MAFPFAALAGLGLQSAGFAARSAVRSAARAAAVSGGSSRIPSIQARIRIIGVKQTQEALAGVGKAALRISKSAVGKSMTPVRKSAANAAKEIEAGSPWFISNALSKSMGKKTKSYRKSSTAVGLVGARKAFQLVSTRLFDWDVANIPKNYIHLVQLGTKPHVIGTGYGTGPPKIPGAKRVSRRTKAGQRKDTEGGFMGIKGKIWRHPGHPGDPFMVKVMKSSETIIKSTYGKEVKKGIAKEAQKQYAKAQKTTAKS